MAYLKEIEKYRTILKGNEDSAMAIAYQTADGHVSDFIHRYSTADPGCSWQNLKDELTSRFAEITDSQHAISVLRKTKQKHSESVQIYAERLLGLADVAWPGQPLTTPAVERQLIDFFIDGVVDNCIARKILRGGGTNNPSGGSTVRRQ